MPDNTEIAAGMFTSCIDLNNIFFETPSENPLNFVIGDDCFYHYDDEINKLVCDRKWKGGNGTIEQTWELIQYKLNYIGLPEGLDNPNPDSFNVENHIFFESVLNKETGKKSVIQKHR